MKVSDLIKPQLKRNRPLAHLIIRLKGRIEEVQRLVRLGDTPPLPNARAELWDALEAYYERRLDEDNWENKDELLESTRAEGDHLAKVGSLMCSKLVNVLRKRVKLVK